MIGTPWLLAALAWPAHATDLSTAEGGGLPQIDPLALPGGPDPSADPIINGVAATEDDHPETGGMLVTLADPSSGGTLGPFLMCSSTLIAPDVVLLAAHCVDPVALEADIVAVGWSRKADLTLWQDGSDAEWPDDVIMAPDWVKHEQFDVTTLTYGLAQNYDVGLLFLSEAVTDVDPAVLPTADEATEIAQDDSVDVVGWGYTTSDMSGAFGNKMMGTSDISRLATYEFQVGELTEAVRKCHGDSGGPTFRTYPNTHSTIKQRQIGITSHTYDMTDCENTGGVDTRVDYYRMWIDAEMRSRCADGSRAWCHEEGVIDPPVAPVAADDLLSDVHLVGCATAPGAAGLAWIGAALALAATRRRAIRA